MNRDSWRYQLVVIGTSAGGFKALETVLPALPANFPVPVIIVQHLAADSDDTLAKHLDQLSAITIKEAEPGEFLQPGTGYIAPGGYHLLIEDDFSFALCASEKVQHSRPSIDVLLINAAELFKNQLLAIILTGANCDGTQGAEIVKEFGGTVIAQDPKNAEVAVMPASVIKAGWADYVLTLDEITQFLLTKIP